MKIDKNKIIILLLCVALVASFVLRPSKEYLSDFYINKYKNLQAEKDSALNEIKRLDEKIINLNKQYNEVDSIYNDISKDELRERANVIFRHNMLQDRRSKVSIK